jgi:hypothetical protein
MFLFSFLFIFVGCVRVRVCLEKMIGQDGERKMRMRMQWGGHNTEVSEGGTLKKKKKKNFFFFFFFKFLEEKGEWGLN